MTLPPDVLDYLLGFLQSDKNTLKACSQSHPILAQLTERHLFANVTVEERNGPDELYQVLRDRPYVSSYIRNLEIKFDKMQADRFFKEISIVLPMLSMLRRIRLAYGGHVEYPELPKIFRLAFEQCLLSPYLTDICIESLSLALSTLGLCKQVRKLSLRSWSDGGGDITRFPTIDSLALHHCDPISLAAIINSIGSSNISSLEFSDILYDGGFNTFPQILACCSHSLTSLDVDIESKYPSYYDFHRSYASCAANIPIPLSNIPNLQQLTIRARLRSLHYTTNALRAWGLLSPIPSVSRIVKPVSSLTRLTLDFSFAIRLNGDDDELITDALCDALHSLLVQSASTIGSIELRVNPVENADDTPQHEILSLFSSNPDLMVFVDEGTLNLTPVVSDVRL